MALMLNDMKEGVSDKVAEKVVDTFLRESEILQMLPFDNTVSPQGGSTVFGYDAVSNKLMAGGEAGSETEYVAPKGVAHSSSDAMIRNTYTCVGTIPAKSV